MNFFEFKIIKCKENQLSKIDQLRKLILIDIFYVINIRFKDFNFFMWNKLSATLDRISINIIYNKYMPLHCCK